MRFLRKMSAMVCAAAMSATLAINVSADAFIFDMEKAHETYSGGQAYSYLFRNDMERRDKYNLDTAWLTPGCSFELEYEWSGKIGEEWAAPVALCFQSWNDETLGVEKADFNDGHVEVEPRTWTDTTALFTYDDIVTAWGSDDFSRMYSFQVHDTGTSIKVNAIILKDITLPEDIINTLNGGVVDKYIIRSDVETSGIQTEVTNINMENNNTLSDETLAIISEISETEISTNVSEVITETRAENRNEHKVDSGLNDSVYLPFLVIGGAGVFLCVLTVFFAIRWNGRTNNEEKQTSARNRHYRR